MFKVTLPNGRIIVPALVVVDMQNGFVSKGGSYDKIGYNTAMILVRLRPLSWYIIANSSYQKPGSYAHEVNSKINYSTNIISLNFYLGPTEPSGLGINLSL